MGGKQWTRGDCSLDHRTESDGGSGGVCVGGRVKTEQQ